MGRHKGSKTGVVVTHEKACAFCGKLFTVKGHPGETNKQRTAQKFCNNQCKGMAARIDVRTNAKQRWDDSERGRLYRLNYRANNREKIRGYWQGRHARLRRKVIEGYGAICACCGETEYAFLTIDHVDNDGSAHRKSGMTCGTRLSTFIIKNHFPPRFQVLCYNCNCAKGVYGECPHRKTKSANLMAM